MVYNTFHLILFVIRGILKKIDRYFKGIAHGGQSFFLIRLTLTLLLHYCSSLPTSQLLSLARTSRSVSRLITKRFLSLACQILVMVNLRLPMRSFPSVTIYSRSLCNNRSHNN